MTASGLEIATLCLPAFVVGGDFYEHYPVRGGVVITVAAVMGKGLGAAIVSSAVRSSLRGAARVQCSTPSTDRDKAHHRLQELFSPRQQADPSAATGS